MLQHDHGAATRFTMITLFLMLMTTWSAAQNPPDAAATQFGPAFTYQGRLADGGSPANALYDLQFKLYDNATGGGQVGPTVSVDDVLVQDGLVSEQLRFGDAFGNNDLWLEISVRPGASSAAYTALSPRQEISPTPFAISAQLLDGRDSGDFIDTSSNSQVKLGHISITGGGNFSSSSSWGITATGHEGGGYFHTSTANASLATATGIGVQSEGNEMGGSFADIDGSGMAQVAFDNRGIYAAGSEWGGYFWAVDDPSVARLAGDNTGVSASSLWAGGYFEETDSDAEARIASSGAGIRAQGPVTGGYFVDSDQSGVADVAYEDTGVWARGNEAGGHFLDLDDGGEAWLGYGTVGGQLEGAVWGVAGYGGDSGGFFSDTGSSSTAEVAHDIYKIKGNGVVSFMQNHPHDSDRVIVYASPEGDEIATYTRGTARLDGGSARVPLGETFQWVTNPDIGLTVHLTPRGDWTELYVESVSTRELVVSSRQGAPDGVFDYMVYGLRIGFEEVAIVQEKHQEAYIPSMATHRKRYQDEPALRAFNALERFSDMHRANKMAAPNLEAARVLRDAIIEYDPENPYLVHPHSHSVQADRDDPASKATGRPSTRSGSGHQPGQHSAASPSVDDPSTQHPTHDTGAEADMRLRSLRPVLPGLATLVPIAASVAAGDVVVSDSDDPTRIRPADSMADPRVVGIAVDDAGIILDVIGESSTGITETDPKKRGLMPVSQSGIVLCRADAGYGEIRPGDLLTASATPGHAALALNPEPGTVVAKALEPLDYGTGLIRVLVMLR